MPYESTDRMTKHELLHSVGDKSLQHDMRQFMLRCEEVQRLLDKAWRKLSSIDGEFGYMTDHIDELRSIRMTLRDLRHKERAALEQMITTDERSQQAV